MQVPPAGMAGNSPLPVAEGVAGNSGCTTPGRKPDFMYSSQGCIRVGIHPGHHTGPAPMWGNRGTDEQVNRQTEPGALARASAPRLSEKEPSGAGLLRPAPEFLPYRGHCLHSGTRSPLKGRSTGAGRPDGPVRPAGKPNPFLRGAGRSGRPARRQATGCETQPRPGRRGRR